MKKTLSELIDELCIVNCKIFHLMDAEVFDGQLVKIKALNKYRSELKNAISDELGGRKEIKV